VTLATERCLVFSILLILACELGFTKRLMQCFAFGLAAASVS